MTREVAYLRPQPKEIAMTDDDMKREYGVEKGPNADKPKPDKPGGSETLSPPPIPPTPPGPPSPPGQGGG